MGLAQTSNNESTFASVPSKSRIAEGIKTLHDSIKVISVTDCPRSEHFSRPFCDCPAAMASLKPGDSNRCKFDFQMHFDAELLGGCEYAFDYIGGNQASRDTFAEKVGKSPMQFARAFLQRPVVKDMFAPRATLGDTVEAMVEYWVLRNAQWKADYGTREKAQKAWFLKAYPNSSAQFVKMPMSLMEDKPKPGGVVMTSECWYGPPAHRCMLHLYILGNIGGKFTMKVIDSKRCHPNCPVMGPQQEQEAVQQFTKKYAESETGQRGGRA